MLQCPKQIRSEVRACDPPAHGSYLGQGGQGGHAPTHIRHSYTLFRPPYGFLLICWYSLHRCINILTCMCACSQTALTTLEVMPWAADEPSFSAELRRIIMYITKPQVGYEERHSQRSIHLIKSQRQS